MCTVLLMIKYAMINNGKTVLLTYLGIHFLESNMPSSEYRYIDNMKEISSVSLIKKICSNYI